MFAGETGTMRRIAVGDSGDGDKSYFEEAVVGMCRRLGLGWRSQRFLPVLIFCGVPMSTAHHSAEPWKGPAVPWKGTGGGGNRPSMPCLGSKHGRYYMYRPVKVA